MTREQGPQEISKRYFSPLEAQMINWMVFNYDENSPVNPYRQLADELKIDNQVVEDAVIRLEKRTGLERFQAMTLVVKIAVLNNELIGADKIFDMPQPQLDKNEQRLKKEFFNGGSTTQICENLNLRNEDFRSLRNRLFRKFNTKNRFSIVAYDTAQRLRK